MMWASVSSDRTGWKVPAPTCSVTPALAMPAVASIHQLGREMQAGGGAATERRGAQTAFSNRRGRAYATPPSDIGGSGTAPPCSRAARRQDRGIEGEHDRFILVLAGDRRGEAGKASVSPVLSRLVGFAKLSHRPRRDRGSAALRRPRPAGLVYRARAVQAGRDNLGIVEHQKVTTAQKHRQVADEAVMQAIGRHIEQPRRIARVDGPLGDQIVRQREIEEIDAHEGGE
jgi:hypothetical protein